METILGIIKRIILVSLGLYILNVVASPWGIFIPINIFTVGLLSLFRIEGFILLVVLYLFFMR